MANCVCWPASCICAARSFYPFILHFPRHFHPPIPLIPSFLTFDSSSKHSIISFVQSQNALPLHPIMRVTLGIDLLQFTHGPWGWGYLCNIPGRGLGKVPLPLSPQFVLPHLLLPLCTPSWVCSQDPWRITQEVPPQTRCRRCCSDSPLPLKTSDCKFFSLSGVSSDVVSFYKLKTLVSAPAEDTAQWCSNRYKALRYLAERSEDKRPPIYSTELARACNENRAPVGGQRKEPTGSDSQLWSLTDFVYGCHQPSRAPSCLHD